jgi:ubiquinone/menaquinone biosynthesis C-methylase UbiE
MLATNSAERNGDGSLRREILNSDQSQVANVAMEFTGERIVPGSTAEALFREHEERYVFAGKFVAGKKVLDVACGTGIGTSFLHRAGAQQVWGLDIDPGAVAFAKSRYPDCQFAEGDATNICLPPNSMDIVVSFETLEHLQNQEQFLRACQRVLKPGGVLICSTPNLGVSRWSACNPYHVREFYPREFRELIRRVFSRVELFGQKDRQLLTYAPRKTIRRVLEKMRLISFFESNGPNSASKEPFRQEFLTDQSCSGEAISTYKQAFFKQPTFLIAVAYKGREG